MSLSSLNLIMILNTHLSIDHFLLVGQGLVAVAVSALRRDDVVREVPRRNHLVASPVGTADQTKSKGKDATSVVWHLQARTAGGKGAKCSLAVLLVAADAGNVAAIVAPLVAKLARMVDPLNDGGCNLEG